MAAADISSDLEEKDAPAVRSRGRLFIISAPSGAGKTTLCQAMLRHFPELAYSVSHTTRLPRKGEQDGQDYFFVTLEEFELGITQDRWAEWAKVHDNYYGSSAQWIDRRLNAGGHILMDIDLQGACQMVQRFPQAITIFIMPPSMDALEKRLNSRGTDSSETVALRLANAAEEIAQKELCRHVLVNDDLESATRRLMALITRYLTGK